MATKKQTKKQFVQTIYVLNHDNQFETSLEEFSNFEEGELIAVYELKEVKQFKIKRILE